MHSLCPDSRRPIPVDLARSAEILATDGLAAAGETPRLPETDTERIDNN